MIEDIISFIDLIQQFDLTFFKDFGSLIITLLGIGSILITAVSFFGKWLSSRFLAEIKKEVKSNRDILQKSINEHRTEVKDQIFNQNIQMSSVSAKLDNLNDSLSETNEVLDEVDDKLDKHLVASAEMWGTTRSRLTTTEKNIGDFFTTIDKMKDDYQRKYRK